MKSSIRRGWSLFFKENFVEWYDLQLEHNNYPGVLLDKVQDHLNESSTVLDIGAGTGAFAIPIAREGKEVTVVEPSNKMLIRLCSKMDDLTNIRLINKCWEDVNINEIGMYDMVIAVNSLYRIADVAVALKKMFSVAKKYLYIIMECRSNFYKKMWQQIKKGKYHPTPSFIHLYNVLYELGVFANVEIIKIPRSQIYLDIKQAVRHWLIRLDLPPEKEDELQAYLLSYLKEKDGMLYLEEEGQSAIIWYEKK
jgi:ubiquinone/menaquinone biosynthesis C-methylase UbiE